MQDSNQVTEFSNLPPVAVVRHMAVAKAQSEFRVQWKKIGLAAFAGIFLGFSVPVAMSKSSRVPEPGLTRNASVASKAVDAEEVQRLKVRNQRLEALVSALRQRAHD